MDPELPHTSKRGRIMGKLFGARDRKASNPDSAGADQVNDFLHGPSDKLDTSHPAPPVLAKLDTLSVTRYPNALNVNDKSLSQQSLPLRTHSPRTRPGGGGGGSRKGLVVRFVDTVPDVIGEGGDECELPTFEIRKRRPPPPPTPGRSPRRPPDAFDPAHQQQQLQQRTPPDLLPQSSKDAFSPTPLRRVQTGYSTISEPEPQPPPVPPRSLPAGQDASAQYLDSPVISKDENRKSFIELHQAQMRQAEGQAFARAVRSSSATGQNNWGEEAKEMMLPPGPGLGPHGSPDVNASPSEPPESPERRVPRQPPTVDQSPASVYSNASSLNHSLGSVKLLSQQRRPDHQNGSPTASPLKSTGSFREVVNAASDDALREFGARTRHLFELFRLHSEAVRPLLSSPADSLARAALWWFLKGRMSLEVAVRDRPTSPESQRANDMLRQQANADLAKGYWIVEEVLPETLASRPGPLNPEVEEVRRTLLANLRKLSVSMKRNGFLPPEDAILPQTLHLSIWLEYPPVSQDVVSLLWGAGGGSALAAQQRPASPMELLEALPLGDTVDHFSYGRVAADVFLMEQGIESQQFYFPCLLSMVRPQAHPNLMFVLASQDGSVQLRVSHSKQTGPTWDDLRWQNAACALEIRLPRGFLLRIKLAPADYKMLWNMYDFGEKVQATLFPRKDEMPVFQSTLKGFQYFDQDPQSRQFPKDAVPGCELAVFERVAREAAATGPRSHHRGFRIAVVTGPRTRTLSGVNHAFSPQVPTQFGFLRGEQETPALLLRFDNGRSKGSMVMSFADDRERLALHSLLLGTKVHSDEVVCSEVPLVGYTISKRLADADGLPCLMKLPWQRAIVVNAEDAGTGGGGGMGDSSSALAAPPPTVLAEKLRVTLDFKVGNMTDRINLAPGEFKIRLDVKDANRLSVLRPPQQDMTVAISEAQVPRELGRELTEAIQTIHTSPTVRTFHFASLRDLHDFQEAVTGYRVLFDGVAAAFAIARRRMVVPIHKKWEAGATRIQVVQHEKVMQLLAFFDDFHHGHCMGFVLKGTDVFEAISRGGKAGIKIDDAKFPLPRVSPEGAEPVDDYSFVCLDLPDLPGEHDDISILFETETDRDRLGTCLPAPMRNSRLAQKFLKS